MALRLRVGRPFFRVLDPRLGHRPGMYRGQGIRSNAIAPGGTATGISGRVDEGAHGPAALGPYFGNVGAVSRPEEQAAAVVFLASDAASNVNGAILPVDNGWAAA
ncbi:MAG: SDR family oxidoreductase [Streptomyces sp.]|nr:SDR family oxidoreductase [Streptomyces sp.]